MAKKVHTWLDRHRILDPEHVSELETNAAVNEFHRGMPREEAERAAYEEYTKRHRLKAAAFHLLGMKSAQASGAEEEARKHYLLYDQHLKSIGLDSPGTVPPEVEAAMRGDDHKAPYRFRSHGADVFGESLDPTVEPMAKTEKTRQCQWKLGERRCKRFTVNKFCHAHRRHEE